MGTTFRDQLVATRDRKHSKDHPFFDLWAQGKLTKQQTAIYCAQHYHYVTEYLNWMAYEASQIPFRDVKIYLYENLGDEENPDDRHLDMLKDYVAATGSSRDSVESLWCWREPNPCKTGAGGSFIRHRGKRRWPVCLSDSNHNSWISAKKSCLHFMSIMVFLGASVRSVSSKNMCAPTKSTARKVS